MTDGPAGLNKENGPLHRAVRKGDSQKLRSLLSEGKDINSRGKFDYTPLHIAAEEGELAIAKLLIERGADVDKKAGWNTPLHRAAWGGHPEIVRLLLRNGATVDPNKSAGDSKSPLYVAVRNQNGKSARVLLENGADPNFGFGDVKSGGKTPLHLATENGHKSLVKVLLENGARPSDHDRTSESTALHKAVGSGSNEIARMLLEEAPHIKNARDRFGRTPLHVAAEQGESPLTLLGYGVEVDAHDGFGRTPLHCATEEGNSSVAEILLENGAKVDARIPYGKNPQDENALVYASKVGPELVIGGFEPIHIAAWKANEGIAEVLLRNGADVNATTEDGKTPLQISRQYGGGEIAGYLKQRGGTEGISDGWLNWLML